ncbi:hydantoinase/oxoprolinase family protein [Actinomycetospora endophytica]|uniref:Hydantoinase/oxoprolinase family protein n=1 Tax=Actinomycetospora endophytica TaxID=2291215 RepID=A0ABS8PHE5_9PSEU|nr:hydantoinase/oxoprolinase family protein [Actinomycetospora endophytica]MCD2197652.1 hydantoinase/oxoprolinase family protein [Actinomycetospora endophytica]
MTTHPDIADPGVESSTAAWVVGIDVGGTFTDIIALHRRTGEVRDGKVLSTPQQEEGVLASIAAVGLEVREVAEIVHGHTVGINALLSRAGERTGLIATRGHQDLLDIGRMHREFGDRFYDPTWLRPHQERPIIPRELRFGVLERMRYDGSALTPLDADSVREAARELARQGVRSVAVCLVNSYTNDEHERRAAEILAEELPDAYVQTSALYPVTKEHERTTTVALDAYVGPRVVGYLDRLESGLVERGFGGTLWIMMMNGGVATVADAGRAPVFQLVSGPVGGVSGSIRLANEGATPDLLTIDVGGTSTDVAAIRGGQTPLTDLWTLETGLTLTMPLVDVESIGSGAGSLIRPNALGNVAVGPASAGSDPGPVCYGRGGTEPTLTDACALLGVLQPDLFANGAIELDVDASRAALERTASQWGMSAIGLAAAAYEVACQDIAAKVRTISVYRGLDVREFALQPSGSAGPMLADRVARILGVRKVVVPRSPGQFSALGLLRTDLRVTRAQSIMTPLDPACAESIEAAFATLEDRVHDELKGQGADVTRLHFERAIFAMYRGQTWDNRMPIPPASLTAEGVQELVPAFHAYYEEHYGFAAREIPVVVSTVEVTAVIPREQARFELVPDEGAAFLRTAELVLPGAAGPVEVGIHVRERLAPGEQVPGPALVTEKFATTVVLPGRTAHVDDDLNLIIEPQITAES